MAEELALDPGHSDLYPWFMNWGATAREQQMALPGDDLLVNAETAVTRAITVQAPIEAVWPWLLQIGQDRAGFYSYDWLENLASGDIHNSDEIRPEWQDRQVGDKVPMSRSKFKRAPRAMHNDQWSWRFSPGSAGMGLDCLVALWDS